METYLNLNGEQCVIVTNDDGTNASGTIHTTNRG
jgi:hypothetical protein